MIMSFGNIECGGINKHRGSRKGNMREDCFIFEYVMGVLLTLSYALFLDFFKILRTICQD